MQDALRKAAGAAAGAALALSAFTSPALAINLPFFGKGNQGGTVPQGCGRKRQQGARAFINSASSAQTMHSDEVHHAAQGQPDSATDTRNWIRCDRRSIRSAFFTHVLYNEGQ